MKLSAGLAAVSALIAAQGVSAVPEWGQCGGLNYSGSKTCDAGLTCVYSNDWYSQCLRVTSSTRRSSTSSVRPSSSVRSTTSPRTTTSGRTSDYFTTPRTTTRTSSSVRPTTSTPPGRKKFQYYGVNQSVAEFGSGKWPGILNTDYRWPDNASIDFFLNKRFNTMRIAFTMERLSPPATGLTGPFDSAYLSGLKSSVQYTTSKGGYAVLDPHNYLRYNGAVITDNNAFRTWWKNLANEFKNDPRVIFDINNEPYEIPAQQVLDTTNAAIAGIRETGATQLILVEGTAWSGAWSWTGYSGNSAVFANVVDPLNNFAIEMHQYLDSDSSGTSATCVSSTIGAERLIEATNWLKANGLKGFLGEQGGGSNDVCIAAIKGAIEHMQQPDSPWIGYLWWAAGPWWGNYFQSIEPPSGAAIPRILPEALEPYL